VSDLVSVAVFEAIHHLEKEITSHWLTELASNSNEIEKLTTFSKLKNNIEDFFALVFLSIDILVLTSVEELDNIWVIQHIHGLNFIPDTFHDTLIQVRFYDFDCNFFFAFLIKG